MRPLQQGEQRHTEQRSGREFIDLADVTSFLRRYFVLIAAFVMLGAAAAVFYVATTDRIYSSTAQILIEPKLPQYLAQSGGVSTSLDTAQIESQIAVMRSEKIAQMVIDELQLMQNPDFFIRRGITIGERLHRLARMIPEALGYEREEFPDLFKRLTPSSAGAEDAPALTDFERSRVAIQLFGANIDIRRVGVSYAVVISFRSRNADLSADVANATAENFVREQIETKAAAARQGGEWLEQRMGEMRAKMNTATQIAQEFRSRHDYQVRAPGASIINGQVVYADEIVAGRDDPTLEELEVTADTYRQMYESFLLAFTNNLSQQSYPVADARVITAATRPLAPSYPRKKLMLAFGLLAGLISGVGVAFLRNTFDGTIRSPRQIREQLGLRCLGELPAMRGQNSGFGLLDEVAASPNSVFSKCLKRAKFEIRVAGAPDPIRSVGVTSTRHDEGKGMVASNLALLYALSGHRTLLVDADTDHSALSRKLLNGRASGAAASCGIVPQAHGKVDLLPSLDFDGRDTATLPDWSAYDMVVVNLPPLESGPESLAVGARLSGVLVVAESGRTSIGAANELVSAVHGHNMPIYGVLLTKVRVMSRKTRRRSPGSALIRLGADGLG